jgi:hypothetical protein
VDYAPLDFGFGEHRGDGGQETVAVPAPGNSLAESLARLRDHAEEDGAYVITVNADETIAPYWFEYGGRTVSVTLTGGAAKRTVDLNETGVTLTQGNNITLRGRSDNKEPLVRVNSGGPLVMEDGSEISGNATSHPGSGVMTVERGMFTMEGGMVCFEKLGSSYRGLLMFACAFIAFRKVLVI